MKKMVVAITLAILGGLNCHSQVSAAETKGTIDAVSGKPCYKCHRSKMSAPFVHSGLADKILRKRKIIAVWAVPGIARIRPSREGPKPGAGDQTL